MNKGKGSVKYIVILGGLFIIIAVLLSVILRPGNVAKSNPVEIPGTPTPAYVTTILAPYDLKVEYPTSWELTGTNAGDCMTFHFSDDKGTVSIMPFCVTEGDIVPDDCPADYAYVGTVTGDETVRYPTADGITYSRFVNGCWGWVFVNSKPFRVVATHPDLEAIDKIVLSLGIEP